MMINGRRTLQEVGLQLPDTKLAAENGGTTIVLGRADSKIRLKVEIILVVLRALCLSTSLTALLVMVTAEEHSNMSIFGLTLPLYSKWSFSTSFVYLVGVSAAVAIHSIVQLLILASRLLRKTRVIPSRNHAWLIFAGDQVFAYAMMSAGSAASGVTNLNRTGIRHSSLPNFCKPLQGFCNHTGVSIGFTFFSCFLLAASAVVHVVWLAATTHQP